ncbi:MAG: YkgJ family cysteine cluster protein [Desulfovermiculus sp.]|nr:YkgJ family cysteine cluster protein [Desulfovermiculus sp.]
MSDTPKDHQTLTCRRCGTCCRSNPPALHGPDKNLYTTAALAKAHLVTFRRGEWVHDNVQDKVLSLDHEMVRIRSLPDFRTCIFYDHGQRACRIYDRRPLECRAFACWDPDGLLHMYAQDRVQRLDLIFAHSALGHIIAEHEDMCSWPQVQQLGPHVQEDPNGTQAEELARILEADQTMRRGLRERTGALEAELDFIFGREMTAVLPSLGLKVFRNRNGYRFQGTTSGTCQF